MADRQPLEAGRLDPARDRAEGSPRDADADGALLRRPRERRTARDPAPLARRGAALVERPEGSRLADAAPAGPEADERRRTSSGRRPRRSLPGDALLVRNVGGNLQRL